MRPQGHTRLRLGLELLEGRVLPSGTPVFHAAPDDPPRPLAQQRDPHDAPSYGYAGVAGRPAEGPGAAPSDRGAMDPERGPGLVEYTVVVVYFVGRYEYVGISRIDIGPSYGARADDYATEPGAVPGAGPGVTDHSSAAGDPPAAASGHARAQAVSPAASADPSLVARPNRQVPAPGGEAAPGVHPAPVPLASRDPSLPEPRLAEGRPGASFGAALPADLRLDVPLLPGRGDFSPAPRQHNGAAEADLAAEEATPGAGAAPETPKAGASPEAPLPAEGAGLLTQGLPAGLTGLERALRALTEAEPLSARRGLALLHWLGASTWVLAAGVAYAVARRRRSRPAGDFLAEEHL